MDGDNGRGNGKRRARQINGKNDLTMNPRRQTNPVVEMMNESQNNSSQAGDDDNDARLRFLSLSLGPTSFSSQIPPMTSSPLAPAMMTTCSPHDFVAQLASSQSFFLMSPSSLSNSLYQVESRGTSTPTMHPPFGPSSDFVPPPVTASAVASRRSYRSRSSGNQKAATIPPPFPWATYIRGKIHSLANLESRQITTITGEVECKYCLKVFQLSYNLREKFSEVEKIFVRLKCIMRERAPSIWSSPKPMRCHMCGRDKAVKPVIAKRKSQINWLFLLLGQMLGYCTLEQLKNFCKHSESHRTGAKNRVLYSAYLDLCKMLEPSNELFNRETPMW